MLERLTKVEGIIVPYTGSHLLNGERFIVQQLLCKGHAVVADELRSRGLVVLVENLRQLGRRVAKVHGDGI